MIFFLSLLMACDEFGLKSTDTGLPLTEDSSVELPDFAVTNIDPNWGPLAGGTTVAIQGNGFEGDVEVAFGNAILEEITILDAQNILIVTPPSNLPGGVDVTIRSDLGSAELNNGFVYSDNGPPDTGDTSDTSDTQDTQDTQDTSDTGVQPTGLVGGTIEFWKVAYACPECFGLAPNANLQTLAGAAFHTPTNGSWFQWLPPQQSCYPQYNPVPLATGQHIGDWIYLRSTQTEVGLRYSTSSRYYENTNLTGDEFDAFQPYELYLPDSNVTIPQVLETPQSFSSVEPSGAFLIGENSAFQQNFSKSNFAITWGPSGTSDSIILIVGFFTPNGAFKGNLVCHALDTGGIGIDPSLLTSYAANDLLGIELYRMQFRDSVLSTNGSTIQGLGVIGLIGTGKLRN